MPKLEKLNKGIAEFKKRRKSTVTPISNKVEEKELLESIKQFITQQEHDYANGVRNLGLALEQVEAAQGDGVEHMTDLVQLLAEWVMESVAKTNDLLAKLDAMEVAIGDLAKQPEPVKDKSPRKWKFEINRDSEGFIEDVITTEIE